MQRCKSILTDLPLHCLNYVDKNDSRLHIYTLFDANTCRDFASCVVFFRAPKEHHPKIVPIAKGACE